MKTIFRKTYGFSSSVFNRMNPPGHCFFQEYERNFLPELQPPIHMPIAHGPVRIVNKAKKKKPGESEEDTGVEEDHLSNLGVTRCAKCSKKIQVQSFISNIEHKP